MNQDVEKRVQNGVDFLDEFFQGFDWWNVVNISTLNIKSLGFCVAGQLELEGLWEWGNDFHFDPELGFDRSNFGSSRDFENLKEEWTNTIIKLRNERYSE